MLSYRPATAADAPLLAELNHHLIQDEGHRNRMTVPELEVRMRNWLATDYQAVLFTREERVVAYGLFRPEGSAAYIRQFFVDRECRRGGIGRAAMHVLLADILKEFNRIYLDVLTVNPSAYAFWKSVGFQDYAVTMEILRNPVDTGAEAP